MFCGGCILEEVVVVVVVFYSTLTIIKKKKKDTLANAMNFNRVLNKLILLCYAHPMIPIQTNDRGKTKKNSTS